MSHTSPSSHSSCISRYYLGHDPELQTLQPALASEVKSFGLCADEYPDEPDRWTPQLYLNKFLKLLPKDHLLTILTVGIYWCFARFQHDAMTAFVCNVCCWVVVPRYVRESVRLVGARVLTQHDVCHPSPVMTASSVGLSKWAVDIHGMTTYIQWHTYIHACIHTCCRMQQHPESLVSRHTAHWPLSHHSRVITRS
jgi:hypothetical protein